MKTFQKTAKVASILAALALLLTLLPGTLNVKKADARGIRFSVLGRDISMVDQNLFEGMRFSSFRRFVNFNKPVVTVLTDQDFFMTHRLFFLHPHFRRFLPAEVFTRRARIIDRDNLDNIIVLRNQFTGPFSVNVNRVNLIVNHDLFVRLSRVISNQNFHIFVNTGNNVVTFNTVVGNIETGDVDIDIR